MSTPSPKPPYWKATIPNGRRRAPWHDYHARCIYMVTANKHAAAPIFGRLIISADHPTPLSRQSCLAMNSLAERICK